MRKISKNNQVTRQMWESLWKDICRYGIRNSQTTALPPTGTSSWLIDASASIEPRFTILNNSGQLLLLIKDEITKKLKQEGFDKKQICHKISDIEKKGNLEGCDFITVEQTKLFATSLEIDINGHMRILKAAQRFVDESISKTFNVPNSANVEEIENLMIQAYDSGLKGIAIFRDGCLQERQNV